MGFRFRKSIKIAPGVKLNFNKKSTGVTFGGKGVNYTINSKGKRTKSIGIPGTGLYYTTTSGGSSKKKKTEQTKTTANEIYMNTENKEHKTMSNKKWYQKSWFIILMLIMFFPVGIFLMWKHSNWNKIIKIIITAIFALFFLIGLSSDDTGTSPDSGTEDSTIAAILDKTETEGTTESQSTTQEETTVQESTATQESTTTQKQTTTKQQTTTTKQQTTTIKQTTTQQQTTTKKQTTTKQQTTTKKQTTTQQQTTNQNKSEMVWIPQSGKKYHISASCSGMKNPSHVTLDQAINWGYTACKKCY